MLKNHPTKAYESTGRNLAFEKTALWVAKEKALPFEMRLLNRRTAELQAKKSSEGKTIVVKNLYKKLSWTG